MHTLYLWVAVCQHTIGCTHVPLATSSRYHSQGISSTCRLRLSNCRYKEVPFLEHYELRSHIGHQESKLLVFRTSSSQLRLTIPFVSPVSALIYAVYRVVVLFLPREPFYVPHLIFFMAGFLVSVSVSCRPLRKDVHTCTWFLKIYLRWKTTHRSDRLLKRFLPFENSLQGKQKTP